MVMPKSAASDRYSSSHWKRSLRGYNDRGPFTPGRCIDLSRAAANAIGIGGTARVKVD